MLFNVVVNLLMDKTYIQVIVSLEAFVALKALCNGILKLLDCQVTTEISGYKWVQSGYILAHGGCAHDKRQSKLRCPN